MIYEQLKYVKMSAPDENRGSTFRVNSGKNSEPIAQGIGHCDLFLKDLQEKRKVDVFQSRHME